MPPTKKPAKQGGAAKATPAKPEKAAPAKKPVIARVTAAAPVAKVEGSPNLLGRFHKKLRESDLDDPKVIKALGLVAMDAEACTELGIRPVASGFKIPYWDLSGKPTKFFRFRYLEDPRTGFAKLGKKMQRYGQLAGTLNEAYFPPLIDWSAIQHDISQTVWITEGELKSACGCSKGLPVIGLGGVWTWRAGKQLVDLLPALKEFAWDKRDVAICYDSDAVTNPAVLAAEDALAAALTGLGAIPRVVRLPMGDGKKVGMDDFLHEHDVEELLALYEQSEGYKTAQALHRMNQEVCYVSDPGFVIVRDSQQLMTPGAFTDHQFANRFHLAVAGDGAVRKVPTAATWLRWENRSQVQKLTYAPGQDTTFRDDRGYVVLNSWKGWGCEVGKGDVSLWHELLDYLFEGSDPALRKWFEQWLAYPVQNPGAKLYTAAVVWGRMQGTGKSMVGYCMRKIYGDNFVEIKNKDLGGDFTAWAKDRQFVLGEEITGGEGMNARRMSDYLKGLITQHTMQINIKNIPSYFIPDCTNYYFTSNHPDCFHLEDSDRRFFIHEAPDYRKSADWYTAIAKWMELRPEYHTEEQAGPRALRAYLEGIDLSDFNPAGQAPDTVAKRTMIMDGQSDIGAWIRRAQRDPDTWLRVNGVPSPYCLFTPQQILAIYDTTGAGRVSVNGVSRELRKVGVRCLGEWGTLRGKFELWMLRDKPTPYDGEWGKAYDEERGEKPKPAKLEKLVRKGK